MSVVGIDLGYQSSFVAVARHGGVETVANEYSDRRSHTMVAFNSKQRLMGVSAKNQQVMNCKNTVYGFKPFLGRTFSDPYVQREIKNLPFDVTELPGDRIGIKVNYLGEEQVFTPEQLTSMILVYLKGVAEKALGKPVADCVVSVPSFFTDAQRRALLSACSIAGLNALRLINETTAVALAYGLYKQDLPEEKEKARKVVFVDMGHHSMQVIICAFNKGKLKVLSKAFDPCLGGQDFDHRLMQHFAEDFKKRYKVDALSRAKQTLRLTTECEKLKKLMSANATAIPLNIECFMDDKDVQGRMKRDDFQELCKDLFQRVQVSLASAMQDAKLKWDDIHSVEITGGSSRIPAVKEIISTFFNMELSTTLNLDEAVARGCALQCAMLSPTFKVREFAIQDIQPFPIQLRWQSSGEEKEQGEMVVFDSGDLISHTKMLTFFRKEAFELEAVYKNPNHILHSNPFIGRFKIKDVKPTEAGESSKVKVKVRMNIHGVFKIKTATMVEKCPPEPEQSDAAPPESMDTEPATPQPSSEAEAKEESNGKGENTTDSAGNGCTDADQNEPESMEQTQTKSTEEGQSEPMEQNQPNSVETQSEEPPTDASAESTKGQTNSQKPSAESDKAKKPKKNYRHVDLPIQEVTTALTKKEINGLFEKECQMQLQDRMETEKADAKNSLEEYVYDMRDKLMYSLREYIADGLREEFSKQLSETEDWLYNEGEDQAKKVYVEHLQQLKKHSDPVIEREKEHAQRPVEFEELGKVIVHYEKILTAYSEGDERYSHIEETEMSKVRDAIASKREWMNSRMQEQTQLATHQDPIVRCSEIRANRQSLESSCNPIVNKPKPKVEPPKDDDKDKATPEEKMDGDGKNNGEKNEEPTATAQPPAAEDMDVD